MPPKAKIPAKHRKAVIIGVAAAGFLLILYLRSRASSGQANATNPTDVQNAATQAAQQQAAQDAQLYGSNTPSTFADNGAGAAQLDSDVNALSTAFNAFTQGVSAAAPGPTTPPTASPSITVNVTGAPGNNGKMTTPGSHGQRPPKPHVPKGVTVAPYYGPHKPTPPKGQYVIGLGHGYWGFTHTKPKK